jgi:hypothetical protein
MGLIRLDSMNRTLPPEEEKNEIEIFIGKHLKGSFYDRCAYILKSMSIENKLFKPTISCPCKTH